MRLACYRWINSPWGLYIVKFPANSHSVYRLGWVHACNFIAYRNTVSCGRATWRYTSTPAPAVTVSSLWCDDQIPTAHRTSPWRYRVTNFWYVTRARVPSTPSRYGVMIHGNVTSVYPPLTYVSSNPIECPTAYHTWVMQEGCVCEVTTYVIWIGRVAECWMQ